MRDYGELCPEFKFYYPNGVPKDAQKRCVECINLDESKLSNEAHMTQNCHCEIRVREVKLQAYKESQEKEQTCLLHLVEHDIKA